MYLRLLLIAAVIATVFAATSFSRAKVPSEVVVVKEVENKMHPNPMTEHEVHTFIEEMTNTTVCYVTTVEYKWCTQSTIFEAEIDSHLNPDDPWRNGGLCPGTSLTTYKPNGWLIDKGEYPCPPAPECTVVGACPYEGNWPGSWGVTLQPFSQFCYTNDPSDFWDEVNEHPCRFLW